MKEIYVFRITKSKGYPELLGFWSRSLEEAWQNIFAYLQEHSGSLNEIEAVNISEIAMRKETVSSIMTATSILTPIIVECTGSAFDKSELEVVDK